MNSKKLTIGLLFLAVSCKSVKPDYIVLETSTSDTKKPVWVSDLKKFEKNKENQADKYKYFVAEGNSIQKNLCRKNAINNVNVTIASEIETEIDNLYTGLISVKGEESIINDDKKEQSKMKIKRKISGVDPREEYWEKRKYSVELGADKDKVSYVCYQLSRVNRSKHDNIINETINDQIRSIKDADKKEEAKRVIEENAEKTDINLNLQ